MYYIELYDSKDGPRFRIKAKNGRIICHSEAYASKNNRNKTVDRLTSQRMFEIRNAAPDRTTKKTGSR